MNLLNKKIPSEKSPSVIIHIYYLLISVTFCYLYYHKFIVKADFHSPMSAGGIYAVLNGEAVKPIQFRILIPYIFKVLTFIKIIPDKAMFFLLTIALTYFIILTFYYLLCSYFKSRAHNCWLSAIIIYPMIWNYVILNGQFFYMDFSVLLVMLLGFYFIVNEKYNWFLAIFFIGLLNHPSVGYLLIAFLFYNYKYLFKSKTILYAALMGVLYFGTYSVMDKLYSGSQGYFVVFNLFRNISLFTTLPLHIILRDLFLDFGCLHLFVIIFFVTGLWKRFRSPMMYTNLTIFVYVPTVLVSFSIEELRNYIAIIPFIMIISLLFLSTFENSFLKPVERLTSQREQN